MTNNTTAPDLIDRLRFCGNLHPQFGHPQNGILFIEAAVALEAAQARIADLEQHVADMIDDSGQECACGYDNPTDICLGHMPMFRSLIEALHDAITRPKGVVPKSAERFYSPAKADEAEKRAALQEGKG